MSLTRVERNQAPPEAPSWFVEPEPVGDRGRLPAAGDPQLGQDPRDVDASCLGGNEQGLTDLPVGPALGDQGEDLGLTLGEAERGSRRGRRCWCRSGVDRFFQAEAAALGKQLDLAAERSCTEHDRCLMCAAEDLLGPGSRRAAGQERLGLPEAGVGRLEGPFQPLPSRGRRPPPIGVGPPF
jgi:hypothetical protein